MHAKFAAFGLDLRRACTDRAIVTPTWDTTNNDLAARFSGGADLLEVWPMRSNHMTCTRTRIRTRTRTCTRICTCTHIPAHAHTHAHTHSHSLFICISIYCGLFGVRSACAVQLLDYVVLHSSSERTRGQANASAAPNIARMLRISNGQWNGTFCESSTLGTLGAFGPGAYVGIT